MSKNFVVIFTLLLPGKYRNICRPFQQLLICLLYIKTSKHFNKHSYNYNYNQGEAILNLRLN